jgi:nitroreductase
VHDIFEVIKNRRSIRKYKRKEIEEQKLNKILKAGCWAPSGLNNQPWRFVLVRDKKLKAKLSRLTEYGEIIKGANVVICVFLDKRSSYHREKDIMAIGACIQNMLLEAHSLGIGSCWLGEILKNEGKVRKLLGLDQRYELMGLVGLGYPAEAPKAPRRKGLSKLILKSL